jgi:hypothetical protein
LRHGQCERFLACSLQVGCVGHSEAHAVRSVHLRHFGFAASRLRSTRTELKIPQLLCAHAPKAQNGAGATAATNQPLSFRTEKRT